MDCSTPLHSRIDNLQREIDELNAVEYVLTTGASL